MKIAALTTLAFFLVPQVSAAGDGSMPAPPRRELPVVLDWEPGVGAPGGVTPMEQEANERLSRHLYVERVLDDGMPIVIRWKVEPSGDYPAPPELFGGPTYPSGIVRMEVGQRTADVEVKLTPTGKPDYKREFKLSLWDAESEKQILGPYMLPVEIVFMVQGDLRCAPGRTNLCDNAEEDDPPVVMGVPLGPKPGKTETKQ
ncbi:hypothetical protein ACVIGB_000108 [Bradyrhizobium sp. USDA 4341]